MFGYEILRGRQGAAGHFRESDGKTVIHARGLKPGETCALYALTENSAEKRGEAAADGNGQAVLTGICGRPFFVTANEKLMLWQGGEDNYLRASEWLRHERAAQEKKETALLEPEEPQQILEMEPEETQQILEKDLKEIQTVPLTDAAPAEETRTEKEEAEREKNEIIIENTTVIQSEQPYSLRSPGNGEPVDTLPE